MITDSQITPLEIKELLKAKKILENTNFSIKIANYIGKPIEASIEKINSEKINQVTQKALLKSLNITISSLKKKNKLSSSKIKHKFFTAISGSINSYYWCCRWCFFEPNVYEPFSKNGRRTFYCKTVGEEVWIG